MRDAKDWASEFCCRHIINSRGDPVRELVENVQKDVASEYIEALTLLWPFIEEELGQMITPGYANAIKAIAECLGKHVVIQRHASGMFYVREVQS